MDAPTAAALQADPVVRAAFAAAWADSFPDDRSLRHEEGEYIYFDPSSGRIAVRRAAPGVEGAVDLSFPPTLPGYYLVATYHTHPSPSALGWMPDPSADDHRLANESGVPWFVVTEETVYVVGPACRAGGCTGPGGYPA